MPPCLHDEVAEWLRRWTANPMGYARVGSNPILVEVLSQTSYMDVPNLFGVFCQGTCQYNSKYLEKWQTSR